ncbi:MAG: ParA family protein [Planctomycetaceae bacterium]|jgi:chromosome partitioning protein|nr:ParA family protein [Planctomycetaceae bacterium]
MTRTFCIANQKGGVGKTTTAITLADALAKSGAKTLLVDFDPQCNATAGLGFRPLVEHPLVSGTLLSKTIDKTAIDGLDLLAGTRNLSDIELFAHGDEAVLKRIREQLTQEIRSYDYVLFDCPPSMGQLTQMALECATDVLMPIQCEYFAMEGLVQMIEVIGKVMQERQWKLEFGGIVLTMVDHSLELAGEVESEVREFFGEIVFESVIPRDAAVSEAPSHGLSVLDYAPRSRGTRAYLELCMEVLERV